MDMTTPAEPSDRRRRRMIYIAAAVTALLAASIGIGLAFAGGGGSKNSHASDDTTSTNSRNAVSTTRPDAKTSTSAGRSATTRPGGAGGSTIATTPGGGGATSTLPATGTTAVQDPTATTTPEEHEIDVSYVGSYEAECKSIWSIAGSDGVLIDIDDPERHPYLVGDCLSLMDTTDEWYIADGTEARAQGTEDAYSNLDDLMVGRHLQNTAGTKTWTSPYSR